METAKHQNESAALRFLYGTVMGRLVLKLLCTRRISRLCGRFLDSCVSKPLIRPFVRRHGIDLREYTGEEFKSFNDFFSRKIKEDRRPVASEPSALIAPCDGLLSAYRISEDTVIPVKQSRYTISSLLGGDGISENYQNGICLVFRLCVNHYHRYCYIDSGIKGRNVFLPGKLHTVRPVALEKFPVFTQNCREYTVIQTENFGAVVQMEVGAMLVGKIKNCHGPGNVRRGEEKGMFLYGGSTVIILLEEGRAQLPEELYQATENRIETPVKMGQRIGGKMIYARKGGSASREFLQNF